MHVRMGPPAPMRSMGTHALVFMATRGMTVKQVCSAIVFSKMLELQYFILTLNDLHRSVPTRITVIEVYLVNVHTIIILYQTYT